MSITDFNLIVYTKLNPNGVDKLMGNITSDGGNYNGYVAIPQKYAELFRTDSEWSVSGYSVPDDVHGGCTFVSSMSKEELQALLNSPKVKSHTYPLTLDHENYVIVGFDTLHYMDTEEMWPITEVAKEASKWADSIREEIIKKTEEEELEARIDHLIEIEADALKTINQMYGEWKIEAVTGYKPCTEFWTFFSAADLMVLSDFNPVAVETLHNRIWPQLRNLTAGGIEALTEYIMMLNWKIWQHYNPDNSKQVLLSEIYECLWKSASQWVMDNLKGDYLDYYIKTTD